MKLAHNHDPLPGRAATRRGASLYPGMRVVLLCCALLLAGCDLPPDEVEEIRESLQARIARGQVYVTHSDTELSYMIRNSEFTRAPAEKRDELVGAVEKEALAFLDKYQHYERIRIYFLGAGTTGINEPYLCSAQSGACLRVEAK